eukprot:14680026-Alexandrium_andersonii.AAC.1
MDSISSSGSSSRAAFMTQTHAPAEHWPARAMVTTLTGAAASGLGPLPLPLPAPFRGQSRAKCPTSRQLWQRTRFLRAARSGLGGP